MCFFFFFLHSNRKREESDKNTVGTHCSWFQIKFYSFLSKWQQKRKTALPTKPLNLVVCRSQPYVCQHCQIVSLTQKHLSAEPIFLMWVFFSLLSVNKTEEVHLTCSCFFTGCGFSAFFTSNCLLFDGFDQIFARVCSSVSGV